MSRKTKINVLLPFKMVGELERLAKLGKRSDYIETAIRNRLDEEDAYNPTDIDTLKLWVMLHNRTDDVQAKKLLLVVREMIL